MGMNTTIAYYEQNEPKIKAFHVSNINRENFQIAFNEYNVHTVYSITIETETIGSRSFRTIYTESEIKGFLNLMRVDF